MKTKFSYMQNKPYYSICKKSCVCAFFFLSFFFFQFSGLIQIVRLINLQLFSVKKKKKKPARRKRQCVPVFFFHTSFTYVRMAEFLSSLDGQFADGLSVSDSLCTAAPSPQKKIGEGVSVGEGATVHCRPVSDG